MLLHYLDSHILLVYCQIVLEDAIAVVPTAIFVAPREFSGGSKVIPSDIFSYHVLLIAPSRSFLSHMPRRDSVNLWFSFMGFFV